jgi:WhiB family redox-sensing transcriptional regulator
VTYYRRSPTPPFNGTEACRGVGADLFFEQTADARAQARALCTDCPIRAACQDWAVAFEEYGYWANTTPGQRKRMRREAGFELVRPEAGAKLLAAC